MPSRPVYVRGKALTCALGDCIDDIVAAVEAGTVRTVSLPLALTDPGEYRPYYRMHGFDAGPQDDPEQTYYQHLFDTVQKAIDDARLTPDDLKRTGIFFGSTAMDVSIYEPHYTADPGGIDNYFTQTSSGFGVIADRVARHFGIQAPCFSFTTACTSSANALLYAAALIEQEELERALVIGYDHFNHLGFYGFESLKLLSSTIYRPFDKQRDGIIMGEACGAVILDSLALHRDDLRIIAAANACDTHNVALHNTDGEIVAQVMTKALDAARVPARDIAAIKAHATGSYHNDLTEASAILKVFGSRVPPVTALKPYVGHTVGASGAVELVLFSESLRRGFIPATPGFREIDEELGLALLSGSVPALPGIYMLNYFGFGGNCTTLIVANTG